MAELYSLPDGWEWKTIEELCEILDRLRKPISQKDRISGEYPYYGATGIVDYINNYIFDERLLLIGEDGAKWGANENTAFIAEGKYWVNNHAHIMRPNKDLVIDSLLIYYLNTTDLMEYITGATVKKLNQEKLKSINIPLPPLEEQKRIVAKLDILFEKIDKAIALHQKNIDEADIFMASVLNDVFVELEEKYEKIPLFDVADVNRGKSKHRPRNDKKLFGGNYPFIQTGDVRNANKYIDTFSETYSEFGLSQSKLWKKGTICMTIAANIGDVAILNIDSCFPDSVVGIYSENNSNDFLYYFLLTLKQQLESQATTTAQMNINLKILQTIGVPLPPLKTQQKVVSYLDEISNKMEKIKQIQKEKMQSLKELKASILDKAFKGEL